MKKHRKFSLTTRYVVIVGLLLFVANILIGIVSISQTRYAMRTMIRKSMLDISNTAAGLMDGDVMSAFTEEDVGSPAYNDALAKLSVFQSKADIEFIYAVRQVGEEEFVFLVDADPVDPGAFGEEIVVTNAVIQAAKGVATVDDAPAEDRWGNFYSAYSPVFDSEGRVAAIVGVDFSSEWYEHELFRHSVSIGVLSILSVCAGAAVMLLITGKVRTKFRELDNSLQALSKNVDELTAELASTPGYQGKLGAPSEDIKADAEVSTDEIEALGVKIRSMQGELERYLQYVHAQAFTDSLTRVGNTNAYQEEIRALNEQIQNGSADFCAAVFDIDNLKIVNDRYGHTCGDRIIRGAADVIAEAFGRERTFRIGGDEFIAIPLGMTEPEAIARLRRIDEATAAFNAAPDRPEASLSLASGAAAFRPGSDGSFREVFVRADEAMYENKGEHHRRMPALHERSS